MARTDNQRIFERLLLLPLFQGLARSEFNELSARLELGFRSVARGTIIARQDEPCTSLAFVLGGGLEAVCQSDDHTYALTERFAQPTVVQSERLFGRRPCYSRTFRAVTKLQMLHVDKAAVRDVLFLYPTFRINYLNMLSAQVQQARQTLWRPQPASLEARFVGFVQSRCYRPAGSKALRITMEGLAHQLLATRLRTSQMLRQLEARGLIEVHRGLIEVPMLERLIQEQKE